MLGLTESSFSRQVLSVFCVIERQSACTHVCILLTWILSRGGVIMISAPLPEESCVIAPDRDCKPPVFCLQTIFCPSHMWMTVTEVEAIETLFLPYTDIL